MFLYTAPFFVALGARPVLGRPLSPLQWTGLALSFAGVGLAMGVPAPAPDPRDADRRPDADGRRRLGRHHAADQGSSLKTAPEKTLAYQLVISAPMLALAALVCGERVAHCPADRARLARLSNHLGGRVTYALWFAFVQRYSPSRLSAYTFLTPLFGVAAGHLVLGEPITPAFAAAVALVVVGLVLVNRPR